VSAVLNFSIIHILLLDLIPTFPSFLYVSYRHLQNTGHMKEFSLISEEAISKGIRRIVAITGPDAERVSD
jgi:hypothetical protein